MLIDLIVKFALWLYTKKHLKREQEIDHTAVGFKIVAKHRYMSGQII